eukprot:4987138-Pyramimonas_sp.AAC.1
MQLPLLQIGPVPLGLLTFAPLGTMASSSKGSGDSSLAHGSGFSCKEEEAVSYTHLRAHETGAYL